MMVAVITALMVALTSLGVTKVNQAAFSGFNSSRVMLQAQQYAEAEAAVVKATAYANLIAHSRADIQNSNGYSSEVVLSDESDYSDTIKQRIASINIYKDSEQVPRYSLNVLKTNAEGQAVSDVPIGAVIAWPVNTLPTGSGTWLECNGQSCSAYPALVAVLGKSTVPDYRNKFLEGYATAGTTIAAGLPNITGTLGLSRSFFDTASGCFSISGQRVKGETDAHQWITYNDSTFDASKSNAIYGKSTTVQPPAVTVKFLIKAN